MFKKIFALAVMSLLLLLATSSLTAASGNTIYDIAKENGNFTQLVAAVNAAGLKGTLESDGPFTVFAPTDDAFAALAASGINPEATLPNILLYHVVPGSLKAADVLAEGELDTAFAGKSFSVAVEDGNAVITTPDGVTANIVMTDIEASNGIIHVIDAVIPPPVNALDLSPLGDPDMTIAEIAVANGNFDTLVAALDAAGLVNVFASPGNYTVFAPTDDAFAALGEDTINALLADPTGDLTKILTYHVVNDALSINQVANSSALPTLNGAKLPVSFNGGPVTVDGATVVLFNIRASNGVIHVIDTVLVP
jgi:uncharacterized surface protein with fasciclin (FAS1) repeats